MSKEPKIAFIYDWFDTSMGGAERVLKVLHEAYPDAPWFTSHIDYASAQWAWGWEIHTSFLQKFPLWFRKNRLLCLLLLPLAFESFDFSSFDVVFSVTSAFAKGVVTKTQTKHICYLLTPPRWLWIQKHSVKNSVVAWLENRIRAYLQHWDYVAAARVDEFISISQEVADRGKQHYQRESFVLYPPFEVPYWERLIRDCKDVDLKKTTFINLLPKTYFLLISRLELYKKVELAIKAFKLYKTRSSMHKGERLVIVGKGSQKMDLFALSSKLQVHKDIVWLEKVEDIELAWLYTNCKGFIMPQQEDFGYVACEAVTCGAPIVSYQRGGQKEILTQYPKVAFFEEQTPRQLAEALEKISSFEYNSKTYENRHIRGWGRDTFVAALSQKITQTV